MHSEIEAEPQLRLPSTSLFAGQWHLANTGQDGGLPGADIRAVEAWRITCGSPEVVIAVLDTGIDPNHPDLRSHLLPGRSFVEGASSWHDDNGHGTEMAGAAAAGGVGVLGVCPQARLLPVKVADAFGHTVDPMVAEGLRWAVRQGASVINISLGTLDLPEMRAAVQEAVNAGAVIVAAAGNSGNAKPPFPAPAMYPEVLAAGGSDNRDVRWTGSSWGHPHLVLAPAVGVLTTKRGGGYVPGGCTSIAAAQVAGLAALVRSIRPDLSPWQVINAIERGADPPPRRSPRWGHGRVNCYRTLQIAQSLP